MKNPSIVVLLILFCACLMGCLSREDKGPRIQLIESETVIEEREAKEKAIRKRFMLVSEDIYWHSTGNQSIGILI